MDTFIIWRNGILRLFFLVVLFLHLFLLVIIIFRFFLVSAFGAIGNEKTDDNQQFDKGNDLEGVGILFSSTGGIGLGGSGLGGTGPGPGLGGMGPGLGFGSGLGLGSGVGLGVTTTLGILLGTVNV